VEGYKMIPGVRSARHVKMPAECRPHPCLRVGTKGVCEHASFSYSVATSGTHIERLGTRWEEKEVIDLLYYAHLPLLLKATSHGRRGLISTRKLSAVPRRARMSLIMQKNTREVLSLSLSLSLSVSLFLALSQWSRG